MVSSPEGILLKYSPCIDNYVPEGDSIAGMSLRVGLVDRLMLLESNRPLMILIV